MKPKAPTPIIPLGGTTTPLKTNAVSEPIAYVAVQVGPETVSISTTGKITVSPACKATKAKTREEQAVRGLTPRPGPRPVHGLAPADLGPSFLPFFTP